MLGAKNKDGWDMALAATARVHGLVLVTRNTKDFEGRGVRLLDPFRDRPFQIEPGDDARQTLHTPDDRRRQPQCRPRCNCHAGATCGGRANSWSNFRDHRMLPGYGCETASARITSISNRPGRPGSMQGVLVFLPSSDLAIEQGSIDSTPQRGRKSRQS